LKRFEQFSFFDLGKVLSAISRWEGDVAQEDAVWIIWGAQGALKPLLAGEVIPIGVCKKKGEDLLAYLDSLEVQYFVGTNEKGEKGFKFPDEGSAPIPSWQWGSLKRRLSEFETVFKEEMRETATYYVPRRGIFYTPALVDSADETFPVDLLPFIPTKAREDWRSAGRCLAFNLLSASGFHAARAVEAMLEVYYQFFAEKAGKTLRSWNDYIDELKKISVKNGTPSPQEKTIAELDQMRVDYRNPIMHPRVVLDESDARMLFANGESFIIAMAQEIRQA
jgi:hypothetical protein